MKFSLVAIAFAAAVASAPAAEARGLGRFGEADNFHKIQDLSVPPELAGEFPADWSKGIELDSHTVTHWLGGGAWLEDKGYAIKIRGEDRYWPVNSRMTKELQDLSILPNPLPKYEIPVMDYVFGYSLWIVIAVLALWYGVAAMLKRKKVEAA